MTRKLNDYGDTHERPIRRTGSLWRPLYYLLRAFRGRSIRPFCEHSVGSGWTFIDYAVLGR